MSSPLIILIRPQMGENIGAVARAMSNFGLDELRIISPRDGWPNQKANDMAAGGLNIVENAKIFPDFASAISDINIVYATTARPRDMNKKVVSPSEAMTEITENNQQKIAIVFGPERTGLENEDITLCDTIITIPTSKDNSSLNIAQSSVIIGYEWMKNSESRMLSTEKAEAETSAPKGNYIELFNHLEKCLDEAEYFRTEDKKNIMWKNLRTMLLRGAWNEQEVRSFRGMIRALWEYK